MRYSDLFEGLDQLIVYHGTTGQPTPHDGMFFSTEPGFADSYGEVHRYRITPGKVFDSLDETHVEHFLPLHDSYDGAEIATMEEYMERSSDTWEMIETVTRSIQATGYDSMVVYEGGIRNYYVFDASRVELLQGGINEAFDSVQPFHWTHWEDETAQEVMAEFQIGDGHFKVMFKEKYYERGRWELSFYRNGTLDLTGTGSAATVLSTVMKITREFIATQEPRWISYAAKNDEGSRNKLYPKLMLKLMKEFPQYMASPPKKSRTYTSYDLERPAKPYVPPAPAPAPEPSAPLSADDWDELEAFMSEFQNRHQ